MSKANPEDPAAPIRPTRAARVTKAGRKAALSPITFAIAFGAYAGMASAALPSKGVDLSDHDSEEISWLIEWVEEKAR
jgi:hypothetical protein